MTKPVRRVDILCRPSVTEPEIRINQWALSSLAITSNSVTCLEAGYSKRIMKNLRLIWFCVSAAFLLSGCARTATETKPASENSDRSQNSPVRTTADVVRVSTSDVSIPAGGSAVATITISISPGYHINANPATFPYLIATEVRSVSDPDDPIVAGKPIYPSPATRKFAFAEQPLAVYEGDALIKLPISLPKPGDRAYVRPASGASIGKSIEVRVQACDEEKCFPPDTLRTDMAVEVK